MASKISDSWQTVAKDKSIIPQKSGMMSFNILPHLHSTKPPATYQTHKYPSPAPVLVAGGMGGCNQATHKNYLQTTRSWKLKSKVEYSI